MADWFAVNAPKTEGGDWFAANHPSVKKNPAAEALKASGLPADMGAAPSAPKVPMTRVNPLTGKQLPQSVDDSITQQAEDFKADTAGLRAIGEGARDVAAGKVARGAHKVISGAMESGKGALYAVAPAAPVATATALVTGAIGQKAGDAGARMLGADEDQAALAGDVAGILAAGKGAKMGPKVAQAVNLIRQNPEIARAAVQLLPKGRAAVNLWTKLKAATEKLGQAEAAPAPVELTPGEVFARSQGITPEEYAALPADQKTTFEHAAKIAQNAAEKPPARPVGPQQPVEPAPAEAAPSTPGKTLAEMLREELEAKRPAAAPVEEGPQPLVGGHTPKPIKLRADAPLRPPLRQAEAPVQETAPPVVEPPVTAPVASDPRVSSPVLASDPRVSSPNPRVSSPPPKNPVEIGQRVLRSMGIEDATPQQAVEAFRAMQEHAGKSGMPLETIYEKYTGEKLGKAPEPPAPKPEPAPEPTKAPTIEPEVEAVTEPVLDPQHPYNEDGTLKSKAWRGAVKKQGNREAKAKRFAEAFHQVGITPEDISNMTAEDAKVMTDGLIAKGLLKKGEMPPNSSLPMISKFLEDLRAEAKAAPVTTTEAGQWYPVPDGYPNEKWTIRNSATGETLKTDYADNSYGFYRSSSQAKATRDAARLNRKAAPAAEKGTIAPATSETQGVTTEAPKPETSILDAPHNRLRQDWEIPQQHYGMSRYHGKSIPEMESAPEIRRELDARIDQMKAMDSAKNKRLEELSGMGLRELKAVAAAEGIDTASFTGTYAKSNLARVIDHKRQVRTAVTAGKPVPPEILAEYPDLAEAPKPEAAPVKPKGRKRRTAADYALSR